MIGKSIKHGMSYTPEYRTWVGMKYRCLSEKCKLYPNYGGRGIKVCDRWMVFENFFTDMGKRPSKLHSINRINNDGDYCPENCNWATDREQMNNRRNTRYLEYNGETLSIPEWSEKLGISQLAIRQRIMAGWGAEFALTIPADKRNMRKEIVNLRPQSRDLCS